MFEDTKAVIKSRTSKKDRQYNGQKKKDRQYNGQKKKDRQYNGQKEKRENYNQRSTKHYTDNKLSSNTNHTKNRGELRCSRKVSRSCFNRGTRRATLVTNLVISKK